MTSRGARSDTSSKDEHGAGWRSRIVRHGEADPADIAAHPLNARRHPQAQRDALAGMLDEVGWVQDVIVNERTGLLVDGHLRVELAIERGEETVPVVYVDLDEREERLVLAALDPLAALAETDDTALLALLESFEAEDDDLRAMLADMTPQQPRQSKAGPEDVPPQRETDIERGQVYQLGAHRLMCGDSTEPDDVTRLLDGAIVDCMVTDPPYAIYGSSTGVASDIADDKMVRPFFRDVLRAAERSVKKFGHVYICCDWRSWPSWWEMAKAGRITPKNLIVWNKGSKGMGTNYGNTYELIGFFAHQPPQLTMTSHAESGQRPVLRPNVIDANRPTGDDRQHNAAKPVDLLEQLITNSTDKGETVLDLFGGSGSTLIAAENMERACLMMEMEPSWCQVIIDRWEAYTGETAVLLDG